MMSDSSDSDTPNLSKARRISRTMSSSSSDADTSRSASDTDDRASSPEQKSDTLSSASDADSAIFESDHEHITVVENAAISLDEAIQQRDQKFTLQLPDTVEIYCLDDAETKQFRNPEPVPITVTEQGPVLRKQSILHKICKALKDENLISTFMYRSKILSDALQIYQFPKDYSIEYEPVAAGRLYLFCQRTMKSGKARLKFFYNTLSKMKFTHAIRSVFETLSPNLPRGDTPPLLPIVQITKKESSDSAQRVLDLSNHALSCGISTPRLDSQAAYVSHMITVLVDTADTVRKICADCADLILEQQQYSRESSSYAFECLYENGTKKCVLMCFILPAAQKKTEDSILQSLEKLQTTVRVTHANVNLSFSQCVKIGYLEQMWPLKNRNTVANEYAYVVTSVERGQVQTAIASVGSDHVKVEYVDKQYECTAAIKFTERAQPTDVTVDSSGYFPLPKEYMAQAEPSPSAAGQGAAQGIQIAQANGIRPYRVAPNGCLQCAALIQ